MTTGAKRGGLGAAIGLIGSLLAILAFLGIQTYKDLGGNARPTTTRNVVAPISSVDPHQEEWDYIHRADDACRVATARSGEIEKYSDSTSRTVFDKWARKVGELRADLLRRWRQTKEDMVDGTLSDETKKIWADYDSANWYWTEMTKRAYAGDYDRARGNYDQYKRFDESALDRANRLGYSNCNYAWPRPTW